MIDRRVSFPLAIAITSLWMGAPFAAGYYKIEANENRAKVSSYHPYVKGNVTCSANGCQNNLSYPQPSQSAVSIQSIQQTVQMAQTGMEIVGSFEEIGQINQQMEEQRQQFQQVQQRFNQQEQSLENDYLQTIRSEQEEERLNQIEARDQEQQEKHANVMEMLGDKPSSQGPLFLTPWHSQRNPVYENPDTPAADTLASDQEAAQDPNAGDLGFKGSPSEKPKAEEGQRCLGGTPLFGAPCVPEPDLTSEEAPNMDFDGTGQGDNQLPLIHSDPNVVDLRPDPLPISTSTVSSPLMSSQAVNTSSVTVQSSPQNPGVKLTKQKASRTQPQAQPRSQAKKVPPPKEDILKSVMDAINKFVGDKKSLIQAMKDVLKEDWFKSAKKTKDNYCNFYAISIGKAMGIPYFKNLSIENGNVRTANQMASFLRQAVKDPKSGWREVTPEEAQKLANEGKFVAVAAKHKKALDDVTPGKARMDYQKDAEGNFILDKDGNKVKTSGHIGVVVPEPEGQHGSGWPWIRDYQNPGQSVRASARFSSLNSDKSEIEKPVWAVWEGGDVTSDKARAIGNPAKELVPKNAGSFDSGGTGRGNNEPLAGNLETLASEGIDWDQRKGHQESQFPFGELKVDRIDEGPPPLASLLMEQSSTAQKTEPVNSELSEKEKKSSWDWRKGLTDNQFDYALTGVDWVSLGTKTGPWTAAADAGARAVVAGLNASIENVDQENARLGHFAASKKGLQEAFEKKREGMIAEGKSTEEIAGELRRMADRERQLGENRHIYTTSELAMDAVASGNVAYAAGKEAAAGVVNYKVAAAAERRLDSWLTSKQPVFKESRDALIKRMKSLTELKQTVAANLPPYLGGEAAEAGFRRYVQHFEDYSSKNMEKTLREQKKQEREKRLKNQPEVFMYSK